MKRLMTITVVMLVALNMTIPGMAVPANAFETDVTRVLDAEIDLSGLSDLATMPLPTLRLATDDSVVTDDPSTTSVDESKLVTWTYDAEKVWKTADQYLQVDYEANQVGWGIQIYTDNTSGSASPQWVETPPNTYKPDAPAGLVGNGSVNYLAIPMAWKAFPGGTYGYPNYATSVNANTEYRTDYTEPTETSAVYNPLTHVYTIRLYQHQSGDDLYGEYSWLVDKGTEKWVNLNDDGVVDPGEIQSAYSDGAEDITVVDYLGSSTCTYDTSGTYIFRDACTSPIYVVLAAKIAAGTIKATYSTNTLTLELFHE